MNFTIRAMEAKDLDITFTWRNDPEVLKYAMTDKPISRNEHDALFYHNNAIKLIFEVDTAPVGFISITQDLENPIGEWSFHMGEKHRGKGLANIMLQTTLYYLKHVERYSSITSLVKTENKRSLHLHDKLGFSCYRFRDGYYEYILELK